LQVHRGIGLEGVADNIDHMIAREQEGSWLGSQTDKVVAPAVGRRMPNSVALAVDWFVLSSANADHVPIVEVLQTSEASHIMNLDRADGWEAMGFAGRSCNRNIASGNEIRWLSSSPSIMIILLVWWLIFNASIVAPSTVTTIFVTKLVMIKMALFATMKEGNIVVAEKEFCQKQWPWFCRLAIWFDDRVVRSAGVATDSSRNVSWASTRYVLRVLECYRNILKRTLKVPLIPATRRVRYD
jgi:hypothetical protein